MKRIIYCIDTKCGFYNMVRYLRVKDFNSKEVKSFGTGSSRTTAQCDVVKCNSIDLVKVLRMEGVDSEVLDYVEYAEDISTVYAENQDDENEVFIVSMPDNYYGELNKFVAFWRDEAELNGSDSEGLPEVSCLFVEDELKKVVRASITNGTDVQYERRLDLFLQDKFILRDGSLLRSSAQPLDTKGYYLIDKRLFPNTSGNGRIFLVRKKDTILRRIDSLEEFNRICYKRWGFNEINLQHNSELLELVTGLSVQKLKCSRKNEFDQECKELITNLHKLLVLQVSMRLLNKTASDVDIISDDSETSDAGDMLIGEFNTALGSTRKKIRFNSECYGGIHERNKEVTLYETPYSTSAWGLNFIQRNGPSTLELQKPRVIYSFADGMVERLKKIYLKDSGDSEIGAFRFCFADATTEHAKHPMYGFQDYSYNPFCTFYRMLFDSMSSDPRKGLKAQRVKSDMNKKFKHCHYASFNMVDAFFEDEQPLIWYNRAFESEKGGLTQAARLLVKDVDIILDDLLVESEIITRSADIEIGLKLVHESQVRAKNLNIIDKQLVVMHGVEEYLKFKIGSRLEVYNQTVMATAYDMIPLRLEKLMMKFISGLDTIEEELRIAATSEKIGLTSAEYDEVLRDHSVKLNVATILREAVDNIESNENGPAFDWMKLGRCGDLSPCSYMVYTLTVINRANIECLGKAEILKKELITKAIAKRRQQSSAEDKGVHRIALEDFSKTFSSKYDFVFKDVQSYYQKLFHDNMYHGIRGMEIPNVFVPKHGESFDARMNLFLTEFVRSFKYLVESTIVLPSTIAQRYLLEGSNTMQDVSEEHQLAHQIVGRSNINASVESYHKSIYESVLSGRFIGKFSRVLLNKFLEVLARDLLLHDEMISAGKLLSVCQEFIKKSVTSLCRTTHMTQADQILNVINLFLENVENIPVLKDLFRDPTLALSGADVMLLQHSSISLESCKRVVKESCDKRSVLSQHEVNDSRADLDLLVYDPQCAKVHTHYKAMKSLFHHKFILQVLCALILAILISMIVLYFKVLAKELNAVTHQLSANTWIIIGAYTIVSIVIGIFSAYQVFKIKMAAPVINKTKISKLHTELFTRDYKHKSCHKTLNVKSKRSLPFRLSMLGIFTVVMMLIFLVYGIHIGVNNKFSSDSIRNIVFSGVIVLLGLVLSLMSLHRRNKLKDNGKKEICFSDKTLLSGMMEKIVTSLIVFLFVSECLLLGADFLENFKVIPSLKANIYELLIKALMVTVMSSISLSLYLSYLSTCSEAKCYSEAISLSSGGRRDSNEFSEVVIYNRLKVQNLVRIATGISIIVIAIALLLYVLYASAVFNESVGLDSSIMCGVLGVVLASMAIALKIFSKRAVLMDSSELNAYTEARKNTPLDESHMFIRSLCDSSCEEACPIDSGGNPEAVPYTIEQSGRAEQPDIKLSESQIAEIPIDPQTTSDLELKY